MPRSKTPAAAAVRAAMLAQELSDDGEAVDLPLPPEDRRHPDEIPPPEAPVIAEPAIEPPVPVPAPQMDTTTVGAIMQLLAASGKISAEAIRQALSDQAVLSRNPIAETYLSGGYPGRSVYSHPDGDDQHPRTVLRCPMFLGIYESSGAATPAFEIVGASCSEPERVALNALTPGAYRIERNDGKVAIWRVVQQMDDLGEPIRLVIAVPPGWLSKAEQAQMPSQRRFLEQLTSGSQAA